MELKLNGSIKVIGETQTWDSGFSKREVVITTAEQYPQDVKIEFVKDKCEVINNYQVGDNVDIAFNVRGNEYNGKYYVNLQGWKINKAEGAAVASTPSVETEAQADDDFPF